MTPELLNGRVRGDCTRCGHRYSTHHYLMTFADASGFSPRAVMVCDGCGDRPCQFNESWAERG